MRLLILDAHNIDMTLADILDRRPGPGDRADLKVLLEWFRRLEPASETEACIFVNVPDQVPPGLRGWVEFLRDTGYRVFAKPKVMGSDVDVDMLDHVERRRAEGHLSEVYVGSHDSRNFLEPLVKLAADGVKVTVLVFEEMAGGLVDEETINVVDLEGIPGLFREPLPRVNLRNLSPEGRWIEPKQGSAGRLASEPGQAASVDSGMTD